MDAKTLHCESCGASVGEHDLRCPYCSSQLATVACPQCLGLVSLHASHCPNCGAAIQAVAAVKSALNCPNCRQPLSTSTVGGLALDQCGKCGGLWVDQATFEKIAADREERGEVMGSLPAQEKLPVHQETIHYRPCPVCAKFMNRQNYAHISGVVLDLCKADGIWFERDELRQVLAFIEGGGLERSRTRQVQELQEERRLTASAATAPAPEMGGGAWAGSPMNNNPSGLSLTGVVESLLNHFFG